MRWPRIGGPRSLVQRFSVLVLVVGLVSLLTQALVLRLWIEPLFEEHAQALASQVRIIHSALRHAAASDRLALAQALSRGPVTLARLPPEGMGRTQRAAAPDSDDAPAAPGEDEGPAAGRGPATAFANRLAGVLGAVKLHDVYLGHLVFELPIDEDIWWLTLRAPVPPQVLADTVLLWLALLAVVTLIATVLGLRWIARPVRRLATELTDQRGSLRPLVADPSASTEIQALVTAFNELVHANAMATSLRQQLLAGVSHDLRTPLTRLRLRIETQCEPPLSDALEGDLLALQHIVDQFLAYVQGDTGLRLGAEQPVAAVVADIAECHAAQGLAVRAEVQLAADDDGPRWPELAARRLIENLVGNALAHGRAPVTIRLEAQGDDWLLSVQDEGPGIAEAEFERARQPFVRLNDTRSELGHCGLGLAIVDQLAQQLGAVLRVSPRAPEASFAVLVRWDRRPDVQRGSGPG
jgi:two-component system, OmpR family, osmolarity sensor histidine kinase EnvZ